MIYIETERLILRSWKPEDLPLFIAMNKDVRVMRYFPAILNDSETEAFYRRIQNEVSVQVRCTEQLWRSEPTNC